MNKFNRFLAKSLERETKSGLNGSDVEDITE